MKLLRYPIVMRGLVRLEIKLSNINQQIRLMPEAFVSTCEEHYYTQVRKVSEYIQLHSKERPIVLLSGPSGSGKTTTAHLLEQLLDQKGHETHTLSMDNYFNAMNQQQRLLAAEKKLDLESPDRVDHALLQQHLNKIIDGQTVELPTYNFVTSKREYNGETLTRKPGEVVILEGIHALNPAVVGLPEDKTVRLYVSVRTRVVSDSDERLHPSLIRLMRRMLRDRVGRGRKIEETLGMFDSVERGEQLYIMPYKSHSQFDIDTLIPYELGIYQKELLAEIEILQKQPQITPTHRALLETMLCFLKRSEPLKQTQVPQNSLLQEFIC